MKLFASTTSPYARKVRIMLIEHGLEHEFVTESLADPNSNVNRLNPLGKVPLLQRDDGEQLFNSPMIAEYIDSLATSPLIPNDADLRWQVQRWHALGDGIVDAVVTRMLEERRPEDKQSSAVIKKQEGKVAAAFKFADEHYSGGEFLIADQFSLADIAFAVAIEYTDFRYQHNWQENYPRLAEWLGGISQRASFKKTIPPNE